ncbi:MAG: FMN-binding protein [Oscillospiraceae bacterium]|nr:FMN-binding protein [Oscillospiraceae bacterium]
MKNKLAAWLVLALVAIVAAVALGVTNEITKGPIDLQAEAAQNAARQALVPDATAFEEAGGVYTGLADGAPVGYVTQVTVQGYGGPVDVTVGTDPDGVLTGIRVGGTSFAETPGLGAKAKDAAFTDQFAGQTAPLALAKDDGAIDAITAATITSSAVLRGVNSAVEAIAAVAGFEIEMPQAAGGALGDGRFFAEAQGFAGPIYVELQLDGSNVITGITIGDDRFAETAGFGLKAKDAAFYEQFIGKTGQLAIGTDVDAIAGATITSNAVMDAVNMAMLYATDPEAAAAQAAEANKPFELPELPEATLTEKASSKGFAGPVAAEITIDPETRALLRLTFGDENWAETDGLGSKIKDDAFWQAFINKTLPLNDGDIDTIAGATITSKAAISAVNKAYYKLFPDEQPAPTAEPTPAPTPAPAAEGERTATASRMGYGGAVSVTITVDDNNVLTALVVGDDSWAETDGIGSKAKEDAFVSQFIGKTLPLADGDVDTIATATVTSTAVIEAVNKAFGRLPAVLPAAITDARTATASRLGYGGAVSVTIMVDDNNVLTALTVGDDSWAETEGIGSKAKEDAFVSQFIGKTLPLADGDVDTIASATVTSTAVIEAVNKAFGRLEEAAPAAEAAPVAEEIPMAADGSRTATASSKGYGGPVGVEITVDANNVLTALTVGDANWAETDGLGSKAKEEAFVSQFIGKTLPLADGDIDTIASATITSDAVIAAVNKAFGKLPEAEPASQGRTATASRLGYGGAVSVTITVDDNNVLTALTVGDDSWAETEGIGSKAKEDAFVSQFIGKTLPLADGDVDTIASATVTSTAVIEAVNKAFGKLAEAEAAPAVEATTDARTATASSKGYGGPGGVEITVDANNVLTALTVGDANWAETDGLGSKAKEETFITQFIGKTLPLADGDIDTIASATITSDAVIAAVNKAYQKLLAQQ